jgi:hypothetical protein
MWRLIRLAIVVGLIFDFMQSFPLLTLFVLVVYAVIEVTMGYIHKAKNHRIANMTAEQKEAILYRFEVYNKIGSNLREAIKHVYENQTILAKEEQAIAEFYGQIDYGGKDDHIRFLIELDLYKIFRQLGFQISLKDDETKLFAYYDYITNKNNHDKRIEYYLLDEYKSTGVSNIPFKLMDAQIDKESDAETHRLYLGRILEKENIDISEEYISTLKDYAQTLASQDNDEISPSHAHVIKSIFDK